MAFDYHLRQISTVGFPYEYCLFNAKFIYKLMNAVGKSGICIISHWIIKRQHPVRGLQL